LKKLKKSNSSKEKRAKKRKEKQGGEQRKSSRKKKFDVRRRGVPSISRKESTAGNPRRQKEKRTEGGKGLGEN